MPWLGRNTESKLESGIAQFLKLDTARLIFEIEINYE